MFKRLLLAACALLLFCQGLYATTVTGTVLDLSGTSLSGPDAKVRFELQNYGSNVPKVSGTAIIGGPGGYFFEFEPNTSGEISVTVPQAPIPQAPLPRPEAAALEEAPTPAPALAKPPEAKPAAQIPEVDEKWKEVETARVSTTDSGPKPGDFPVGSLESRAAARAMLERHDQEEEDWIRVIHFDFDRVRSDKPIGQTMLDGEVFEVYKDGELTPKRGTDTMPWVRVPRTKMTIHVRHLGSSI